MIYKFCCFQVFFLVLTLLLATKTSALPDKVITTSLEANKNLSSREFDINVTVKDFDMIISWGEGILSENQTICAISLDCISECTKSFRFKLPCSIDRNRRSCTIPHYHEPSKGLKGVLEVHVVETKNQCDSCKGFSQFCGNFSSKGLPLIREEIKEIHTLSTPEVSYNINTTAITVYASIPQALCFFYDPKITLIFAINKTSDQQNQLPEAKEVEIKCPKNNSGPVIFPNLDSGTWYDISVMLKYSDDDVKLVNDEYHERIRTDINYFPRNLAVGISIPIAILLIILAVVFLLRYKKIKKKVGEIPDYLNAVKLDLEKSEKNDNFSRKSFRYKEIPDVYSPQSLKDKTIKPIDFDKQEKPNLLLSTSSDLEQSPEDKTDIDHKKSKINVYVSSPSQMRIDVIENKGVLSCNNENDVEYPEIFAGSDTYITKLQVSDTYFSKEKFGF